jgi:hypothetical protein
MYRPSCLDQLQLEKIPRDVKNIIWEYIGCVCNEYIEIINNMPWARSVFCGYMGNHTCIGSINCKSKDHWKNACPFRLIDSNAYAMTTFSNAETGLIMCRTVVKQSETRIFVDSLISDKKTEQGEKMTIHNIIISYSNNDEFKF